MRKRKKKKQKLRNKYTLRKRGKLGIKDWTTREEDMDERSSRFKRQKGGRRGTIEMTKASMYKKLRDEC